MAAAGRTSARGTAACSWRSTSLQVRTNGAVVRLLRVLPQCHPLDGINCGTQAIDSVQPSMATIDCCTECPVPAAVAAPPLQPTTTARCTTCCWRAWSLLCCWSSWSPSTTPSIRWEREGAAIEVSSCYTASRAGVAQVAACSCWAADAPVPPALCTATPTWRTLTAHTSRLWCFLLEPCRCWCSRWTASSTSSAPTPAK